MRLERTKNTVRNAAVGYFSRIVLVFFPFLTRSIFIHCLGEEFLGLNGLFSSILSVLNMAELGFSSAIIVHMYRAIALDDDKQINALLNYYKNIYRVVGTFIFVAGCVLIPFLPKLIQGKYPDTVNLTVVYLVYLFNTAISYFLCAYYSSLISAFQRKDILTSTEMATKVLMYLLQILLLITVRSYYAYLAIMPVFTILNNLWAYYVAKRLFPQYMPQGKITPEVQADIGVKVKGAVIGRVAGVFRNTFDSIFISAFLGLTATAIYGNYYYIMNTISVLLLVVPDAAISGAGNSIATETQEKNYRDMNRMNFLYMWMSGWCMVCMLSLYQPFMTIWMGKDLLLPASTMVLFCAYLYIMKSGDILAIYSEAIGLYWEERFVTSFEAVANIMLNYFLGKYFGIAGILWATIISMSLINFLFGCRIVFKYYFTDYSPKEYIVRQIHNVAIWAVIGIITFSICSLVKIPGILGLLVIGIICVILPNALYFAVHHKTEIYRDAVPWIMEKLPGRKRK